MKNVVLCAIYLYLSLKPINIIGKTTWAKNYAAAHPEKKFEIINAALYLEKATVNGDSRKNHTTVRFFKSPFLRMEIY